MGSMAAAVQPMILGWELSENRPQNLSNNLTPDAHPTIQYMCMWQIFKPTVQGSAKRLVRGCEKFLPALA